MSNRRTTIKSAPPKKRPRSHLLFVYGALIVAGIVLLILGQSGIGRRPGVTPTKTAAHDKEKATAAADSSKPTPKEAELAATDPVLVDDDGKTLWQSPTSGPPLKLSYLPPGVQFVLAVRPASIAGHDEGNKVFGSLGPTEARALEKLNKDLPSPDGITQAIIGFSVSSDGDWNVTEVVYLSGRTAAEYFESHFPNATEKRRNENRYWINGDRAYYLPGEDDKQLIVIAPAESIADIIDLAGDPPPLRRDIERLLTHTDADRDVTVVVAPNSLFSEGRSMFDGEMPRLRAPLFWFLGDELSAAALSLDWGENFFVELVATPTLDTSPERAARILAERVAEIPDKLEAYVVGLQPQPYGRMIVARFPAMIRKLSTYTRSGFDSDHVVLNAYLPAVAGHNLLMGAELTLAEAPGNPGTVAEATSLSKSADAVGVAEKLQRRTTLRFGRDTLDAALKQLSQDIGVPIVIRGPDLQADGITKNQSFGIDLADKPAEEVLIEILRLSNPDKTATGANDVKQKLVYIIAKGKDGVEQILVTTRAAAATRGDALPAAFRLAKP